MWKLMKDGGILCPDCAAGKNGSIARTTDTNCPDDSQWIIVGDHVTGGGDVCDHCGTNADLTEHDSNGTA